MAEATYRQAGVCLDYTPTSAVSAGTVVQLGDGRAAVVQTDLIANQLGSVCVEGVFELAKTASVNILDGGNVYWDHSANTATFKTVNDRDFRVGVAVGDSLSTATTVMVALNVKQRNLVDMAVSPFDAVLVNTATTKMQGGAIVLSHTSASEAAKADALSKDGFTYTANAIVECAVEVVSGTNAADDFSIGVASATHASDADSIANHVFAHLDLNAGAINIQSKDPTTTVAAADSTKTWSAGARFEVWFDMRDPADIQVYINGDNVLPNSTFRLDNANASLFLLAHLEKSSAAAAAEVHVDWLRARLMEQ